MLHDQKIEPILLANVVEGADVRVVQARHGSRLALESLASLRTVGNVAWQHLHGDNPVQPGVSCLVHLAHAAGADGGKDFVRAESGSRSKRHKVNSGSRCSC